MCAVVLCMAYSCAVGQTEYEHERAKRGDEERAHLLELWKGVEHGRDYGLERCEL